MGVYNEPFTLIQSNGPFLLTFTSRAEVIEFSNCIYLHQNVHILFALLFSFVHFFIFPFLFLSFLFPSRFAAEFSFLEFRRNIFQIFVYGRWCHLSAALRYVFYFTFEEIGRFRLNSVNLKESVHLIELKSQIGFQKYFTLSSEPFGDGVHPQDHLHLFLRSSQLATAVLHVYKSYFQQLLL